MRRLHATPLHALLTLLVGACQGPANDLSEAQLGEVIDRMRPTIQACYQAALDREPYAHAVEMSAAIHVRPSGEVYQVEIPEGGLKGMRPCVEQAILRWRFPTASDETHASLPLVFKPERP